MSDSSQPRYQRAKHLAEQALALSKDARAAWVAEHCRDDPELLAEVDWLVAAAEDASADDVPERFHSAARSALKAVSLEVPMPRNYRLLERLDAGGTGVVYRAERVDGEVTQQVALKLLMPARSSDDRLAERFANEHRALARLNHPCIAHLIDGGLTAEGRPFLATEYVDGEPIDEWCRRRKATLGQRIELMIKVCEAVDYAHRHMVIHRDLKPSNILVTAEGEPKLLDFGIARLLDVAEEQPVDGGHDGRFMTLAYASPEQVSGDPLSAATDVYSLGVVLYELLSGGRPFDELDDPRQRLDAVQNRPIPSLRAQAAAVDGAPAGRIPADVAAIVHRALARTPGTRYPAARDLAADLERWLHKRPVDARGGGSLYRLQRFVSRHRAGVALSVIGAALLTLFLVEREQQLQRIAWERDRAEAVTDFMNEIFSGADSLPSRGNAVTVRELLDLGSDRLQTRAVYNPAVLGSIHQALGRAYNALGLGEQALPLLLQAEHELSDSASLIDQARIQADIAAALDSAGRAAQAIVADQQAIALLERSDQASADEILRLRVRKLRNHANVLDLPLDQIVRELEAITADLGGRGQGPDELLFEAQSALVAAYVFQDRAAEALALATAARAVARELYAEDDPRRLRGRHVYATALMLSDPASAIELFESLIVDHQRLIGPSQRLANSLGNLGVALARAERAPEGIEVFARAAEMIESVADREHYLYRLSVSNQAALHLRQFEPETAERLIRDLLDESAMLSEPASGVDAAYKASAMDILGSALALQDRLDEAAEVYRRALTLVPADGDEHRTNLHDSLSRRLAAVEAELDGRAEGR
ncbi:MAG: serine/threonine protein kinase [Wenzhouxiangella sp.]|nr:MAG: serine/threonine protein kinase [Wenzhouxiangella sp.]